MKKCTFCEYAKHKADAPIAYENKYVMAFIDEMPAGPIIGHMLVIPKKHFGTIEKVEDKYLLEIMKAIKKLAPAVMKVSDAEGLNIIQNNGKAAGQAEPHIHFHLIPRKHGDGIWLNTNRRKPKPMEMLETAKAIERELK